MITRTYIDGIDIFSEYGVFVTLGSYDSVIEYPSIKSIDSNNWAESDGEEPDLSDLKFDSRSITIGFGGKSRSGVISFLSMLSKSGYRRFYFDTIDRTYFFRLSSMSSNKDVADKFRSFSLSFEEDSFDRDDLQQTPLSTFGLPSLGYAINGVDIADYGIIALSGTRDNVTKQRTIKEALTIDVCTIDGVEYDSEAPIYFESMDVTLKLLLRATTLTELWRNYEALLYQLTEPDGQSLSTPYSQDEMMYYKSSSVGSFVYIGQYWIEFDVKVVFYGDVVRIPDNIIRLLPSASMRLTDNGLRFNKNIIRL